MLFRVNVPPEKTSMQRTDILKSTPTLFQFAQFYIKNKDDPGSEGNNVTIEQTSTCNFRVTGKWRYQDWYANLDNTLDFITLSGGDPELVTERPPAPAWPRHYLKISGVKACSRKGSFRGKDFYFQLPETDQCSDYIYSIFVVDNTDLKRLYGAFNHFKQTYCKGRAF